MPSGTGDHEASPSPSQSQSADESGEQEIGDMVEQPEFGKKLNAQGLTGAGQPKNPSSVKDPTRPRRKKARRACYACQRAHLTCGRYHHRLRGETSGELQSGIELMSRTGDERPCQRCVKRGLQDQCQDGVRKKAKYLHDAPNEALMPGVGVRGTGNRLQYVTGLGQSQQMPLDSPYQMPSTGNVFATQPSQQSPFNVYTSSGSQIQMPPPSSDSLMNSQSFSNQQSPVSPHFNAVPSSQASPMQNMAGMLQANPHPTITPIQGSFNPSVFDAGDSIQYNFDPASFNFGNHYGALEFGMLGQMSSGAAETSPSDSTGQVHPGNGAGYTTPGTISTGYSGSPGTAQPYIYSQDQSLGEWRNDGSANMGQTGGSQAFHPSGRVLDGSSVTVKQEAPHGYAIGAGSGNFTSSSCTSSPQTAVTNFDDRSNVAAVFSTNGSQQHIHDNMTSQRQAPSTISTPNLKAQGISSRRTRDPSAIYESVKEPYSYTAGFHSLTALLQRRFSPQKTLRIAKALASIRPSFISCTKTLSEEDLIFMEKCFQRTLWEYEDFINACGTPTIVCRRTGEVAAVGKEFSILTGWNKDVLLGMEPNLNVNTGGSVGQTGANAVPRGNGNSSRIPENSHVEQSDERRPQPVFLAELLDDDSTIQFYEDFARLAFNDSRGSVTAPCKLLRYKTANDLAFERDQAISKGSGSFSNKKRPTGQNNRGGSGETGIYHLADKDGKVDCSYCWTVKRDVFDIPMMIVMNVSSRNFLSREAFFILQRSRISANHQLVSALYITFRD